MARPPHPNIVSVHDFGETAARCAGLLMELVDVVKRLRQACRSGAPPAPKRPLAVVPPHMFDALQYAPRT